MASIGIGGGGNGQDISRDQIIVIITRTQAQVEALTKSVADLKNSIEEMVDRLEADADDMRSSISGLGGLTDGHKDVVIRLGTYESRLAVLETWQIQEKTTIKIVGVVASVGGALLGTIIGHFWK